jgi:hypothetical protein
LLKNFNFFDFGYIIRKYLPLDKVNIFHIPSPFEGFPELGRRAGAAKSDSCRNIPVWYGTIPFWNLSNDTHLPGKQLARSRGSGLPLLIIMKTFDQLSRRQHGRS